MHLPTKSVDNFVNNPLTVVHMPCYSTALINRSKCKQPLFGILISTTYEQTTSGTCSTKTLNNKISKMNPNCVQHFF